MNFSIKDKVAVVTGANRGIGKAIVETFLEHGAKKVYLAVRNPNSTKELEDKYGDKVVTVQADVTDGDSIIALAAKAQDAHLVVNNAGIAIGGSPLSSKAPERLQKEMDVNVYGLLRVAKAFSGILATNKGAFVQLNSVSSMKNFTPIATYSATKAAAYSLTQALRDQLGESGVQVLSVHPGPIDTDMAAEVGFPDAAAPSSVSEGILKSLEAGDFLLFPDPMAKQLQAAYQSFSDNVIAPK